MKYDVKGYGKFKKLKGTSYGDTTMEALVNFLKMYNYSYTVLSTVDKETKGVDYFSVTPISK